MITIYHKSSCNTSNRALNYLRASGKRFKVIDYLTDVPKVEEIEELLVKLGISAEELVRKKEPVFQEKFSGKKFSEKEWVKILNENPILIQRPILAKRTRAIIARPPELVISWIKR